MHPAEKFFRRRFRERGDPERARGEKAYLKSPLRFHGVAAAEVRAAASDYLREHPELDRESTTTSELLQAHLPTSRVVKAFNHIQAAAITSDSQPAGTANRRALVIAGDDADAKAVVAKLVDQFGFDVMDAGPLKEGWRIQRDTPGYGPRRNADEMRRNLASAKRYADMR